MKGVVIAIALLLVIFQAACVTAKKAAKTEMRDAPDANARSISGVISSVNTLAGKLKNVMEKAYDQARTVGADGAKLLHDQLHAHNLASRLIPGEAKTVTRASTLKYGFVNSAKKANVDLYTARIQIADAKQLSVLYTAAHKVVEYNKKTGVAVVQISKTSLAQLQRNGFTVLKTEALIPSPVRAARNVATGNAELVDDAPLNQEQVTSPVEAPAVVGDDETKRNAAKDKTARFAPVYEDMWNMYYDYEDLYDAMVYLALLYPNIVALYPLGDSIDDNTIYALRITNNVDVIAAPYKPSVRLTANIHGNDAVGRQLLFRLAVELAWAHENASTLPWDEDIADNLAALVDELDIWIVPTANPDGFEAGRRCNEDGVDINVDFPSLFLDNYETYLHRWIQPETRAYMSLQNNISFALAIDFFGGAVGVSYPYDGSMMFQNGYASLTPDNDLYLQLAHTYADNHPVMSRSTAFTDGIINGAEWFLTYRTAADWTYSFTGTPILDVYLSEHKWPLASTFSGYWADNRDSIVAELGFVVGNGVRGLLTSNNHSQNLTNMQVMFYLMDDALAKRMGIDAKIPGTVNQTSFAVCDYGMHALTDKSAQKAGRLTPFLFGADYKPFINVRGTTATFATLLAPGIYSSTIMCNYDHHSHTHCHFDPMCNTIVVPPFQTEPIFFNVTMQYHDYIVELPFI